ncbi:tyrosine-type recombinase/integrase [Sphingomonas sp. G-3-2-10]|uniref:tyrosine-type recombinase/integrase n=1 Tax=Sphingomonas sp. G-3-2-10 TaxID=2728838 RepID=UPI00146DF598|nr:tyrosine-type recombinase/integrase [Sphingomonas sp. G-3-2-10]NML06813.1 tyrosine-type recombinase/integrase [Sphingomonas sp. G-3-2-10]
MSTERVRITKRVVDGLCADGTDRFLWDSDVIGFGLRISPAGKLVYILQYRFDSRQRRFKIGPHGSPWTPETARAESKVLLGKVAEGIDPQEIKIAQRKELTVGELCDAYLAEGLLTAKQTSIDSARKDIENHIKPRIGRRRASKLSRADVEQMLREVAEGKTRRTRKTGHRGLSRTRGGKGAANKAVSTLSAALGFGVMRGVRLDNPAIGVKKFPSKKMERFLSPAELARLGETLAAADALGVESPFAIAAIRLLILTGCRRNEILTLKRGYIDPHHRCLRLPDSKTGAKIVHLGAPAMKVIVGIPYVEGNPYLLPGKKEGTRVTDLQAVWTRVRVTAGIEDVRIHDLRHSFASVGASNGDSMLIIGALLGHRSTKTTERYTHLSDHPLKSAADRISDEIAKQLDQTLSVTVGAAEIDDPFAAFWALQSEIDAPKPDPILGAIIKTCWLDTPAVAVMLGMTVGTLQTYRWMGTGPAFRKIGRRVVYSADAVKAWAEIQNRTMEFAAAA